MTQIILGFILFIGISSITLAKAASIIERDSCHPTPPNLDDVYMVGYGSLISSKSKNETAPNSGINIPVNIHGFERKFNCMGSPVGLSTTFLGVDKSANTSSYFNGVVFKLPSYESLKELDKRERYYCRQQVDPNSIDFLTQEGQDLVQNNSNAQYWIYVVKDEFNSLPSKRFPIVQSYVDVFLSGCLEMTKSSNISDYADKCMETTVGWDKPWVNDRILPRRPFVHTPMAYSIDKLISNHLPNHFDNVVIEQEIRHNQNSADRFIINPGFILFSIVLKLLF